MAILYPDWNTIYKLHQKPTAGELHLLHYLDDNLDDDYEIFFQANINGDRPDIVLMRNNSGVLIIEVKDWNLNSYRNQNGEWYVKKDGREYLKLSPFEQVKKYKENLYDLNVPSLLEKNIKNSKMFSVVGCSVYFHNANKELLNKFLNNENLDNKKFIRIFCKEELTKYFLNNRILSKYYLNRQSKLFSDDLYDEFKRMLKPPFHTMDEGIDIKYSKEQQLLIKSSEVHQKIKGVAGSGKTVVLAKRAVNAHLRTREKVLILCYNITLPNYIHDLISKVRENFDWQNFEISNYHQFISSSLNNLGISPKHLFLEYVRNDSILEKYWEDFPDFNNFLIYLREKIGHDKVSEIWEKAIYSNQELFAKITSSNIESDDQPDGENTKKIERYNCILIDEVQDYSYKWLEILKNNFLDPNGEYVLFGDEKQNIYGRELDFEKLTKTNVKGKWNRSLNKTYRIQEKIAKLASEFQDIFFKNYTPEIILPTNQLDLFGNFNLNIEYYEYNRFDYTSISNFIINYIKSNQIHSNDVCLLGTHVRPLRQIDYYYRNNCREKTTTTFETEEIYKLLFKQKIQQKNWNSNVNPKPSYLEDDLQIALRKVIDKLDLKENESQNDVSIIEKPNNTRIDELVDVITPRIELEIEKIRKNKKFNFWMDSGHFKISTVHSFKGWEIPVLFLLLDPSINKYPKHELIYTALTRCKFNLVIINMGSRIYNDFFKEYADIVEQIEE